MSSPDNLALADVNALLKCLGVIYAHANKEAFRGALVHSLAELVPSETVHLTEIDAAKGEARTMCNEHDPEAIRNIHILGVHADSHPRIVDFLETADGRAIKISDYLSRAEWEERAVFKEFYVPSGYPNNDQMCLMLPTDRPKESCVAIAFNRLWGRTTERDRLLLNLVRPHIVQGFRNAEAVDRLESIGRDVESILSGVDLAAVTLDRDGRATWSTPTAQALLKAYFPSHRNGLLPSEVRRWLVRSHHALKQMLCPIPPYVVHGVGRALSIRCVRREGGELLILEEQARRVPTPRLSPRLEQVLALLKSGESEKRIAAQLGLSQNTVHHYVKAIYRAFDVNSRPELLARLIRDASH